MPRSTATAPSGRALPRSSTGRARRRRRFSGILQRMTGDGGQNILVTRMAPEAAELVQTQLPLDYHPLSKVGIAAPTERPQVGNIVIVTGGTSDIPVCRGGGADRPGAGQPCDAVCTTWGCPVCIGLLAHLDVIMSARVLIVAAGHGRGAGQRGGRTGGLPGDRRAYQRGLWRQLRRRLPPCWPCSTPAPAGVSVVNIDNGFGAGYQAIDDQSDEGDLRR